MSTRAKTTEGSAGDVILGTARIKVKGKGGFSDIRALCDNFSQVSLITIRAIKELGIKSKPSSTEFVGIGGHTLGTSTEEAKITIKMKDGQEMTNRFSIVEEITEYQPTPLLLRPLARLFVQEQPERKGLEKLV